MKPFLLVVLLVAAAVCAMATAKPSTTGTAEDAVVAGCCSATAGLVADVRRVGRPSPYWKLERRYVRLQHEAGRLGAEVRRLRRDRQVRTLQAARGTEQTIRLVFWNHGDEAVRVSSCETGGTFSTSAQNGQYLGIFQMGDYARSTYGHGPTVLEQALAAYRYFVASGYSWGPWECKP